MLILVLVNQVPVNRELFKRQQVIVELHECHFAVTFIYGFASQLAHEVLRLTLAQYDIYSFEVDRTGG